MIKVVTTKGEEIKEFNKYSGFFSWLLSSDYGVVDYGKDLDSLKREGGMIIVQQQDDAYLKGLHIKED